MKIEVNDWQLNDILYDVRDGMVAWAMKEIIDDDQSYTHPGDIKYHKKLKKAAKVLYKHFSPPGK